MLKPFLMPKSIWSYNPSPTGCVLYLPFWHPNLSGPVFKSIDGGHICTATNTTYGPTGRIFAGVDYITVPDHSAFDITTNLSVFAWVQATDISGGNEAIATKYAVVGNLRGWYFSKDDTNGKLKVNLGDPNDGTFESTSITDAAHLVNATWVFVGFTYDTGTLLFYVAGVSVAFTTTVGAVPATLYDPAQDILIGSIGGGGDEWNGKQGEEYIYNRTLTTGEALHIYNKTKFRYT